MIVYLSSFTELNPITEVLVPVFHLNGVVLGAFSQAATASANTEPSTKAFTLRSWVAIFQLM